jgi:hypothetical protein
MSKASERQHNEVIELLPTFIPSREKSFMSRHLKKITNDDGTLGSSFNLFANECHNKLSLVPLPLRGGLPIPPVYTLDNPPHGLSEYDILTGPFSHALNLHHYFLFFL